MSEQPVTKKKQYNLLKQPLVVGLIVLSIFLGSLLYFNNQRGSEDTELPMQAQAPSQNQSAQEGDQIDQNRAVIFSRHITEEEFQQHIAEEMQKELAITNETVLNEAFIAADETENALRALENDKTDEAFTAIEKALGKLELLLSRYPEAELTPLLANGEIVSLVADKQVIETKTKQAKEQLELGNVQAARMLLSDVVSEIRISTLNIPVGAYTDALKVAANLVEQEKTEEAKQALRVLLSTLVVEERVVPIPILNAQLLVNKAAALAENDSGQALEMIEDAREQVEIADLMGYRYATPEMYEGLRADLTELEEKLSNDETAQEIFTPLKESLEGAREQISQ